MCRCHGNINEYKQAFKIGFDQFVENLVLRLYLQAAGV